MKSPALHKDLAEFSLLWHKFFDKTPNQNSQ
ncbi:hypothetical protein Rhein_3112 [Rheinheimera sp. A13L]|nr:hypothetical protein Rhein_3112 [Rheinheimera sp. A13L]